MTSALKDVTRSAPRRHVGAVVLASLVAFCITMLYCVVAVWIVAPAYAGWQSLAVRLATIALSFAFGLMMGRASVDLERWLSS